MLLGVLWRNVRGRAPAERTRAARGRSAVQGKVLARNPRRYAGVVRLSSHPQEARS